jgi:hypothetical protein
MKKTFIIIGLFFLAVVFAGIFSALFVAKNKKNGPEAPFTVSVQPNTSPTGQAEKLSLISSDPADKATDVPVNTGLQITFNKPLGGSDILFAIDPNVPLSADIMGKTLVVTFQAALAPGQTYTYRIDYLTAGKFPHTYSFTTTGPARTYLPDTRSVELIKAEKDFQKVKHTDVYLANMMPYTTPDFSVKTEFIKEPLDSPGHFQFTVTAKGISVEQAVTKVNQWLLSQALTGPQIQTLDIKYQ